MQVVSWWSEITEGGLFMDEEKKSVSEVGSKDSGYLVEFRGDGVYLTVFDSQEPGIKFELSDMRLILKEYSLGLTKPYPIQQSRYYLKNARVLYGRSESRNIGNLRYMTHLACNSSI